MPGSWDHGRCCCKRLSVPTVFPLRPQTETPHTSRNPEKFGGAQCLSLLWRSLTMHDFAWHGNGRCLQVLPHCPKLSDFRFSGTRSGREGSAAVVKVRRLVGVGGNVSSYARVVISQEISSATVQIQPAVRMRRGGGRYGDELWIMRPLQMHAAVGVGGPGVQIRPSRGAFFLQSDPRSRC